MPEVMTNEPETLSNATATAVAVSVNVPLTTDCVLLTIHGLVVPPVMTVPAEVVPPVTVWPMAGVPDVMLPTVRTPHVSVIAVEETVCAVETE